MAEELVKLRNEVSAKAFNMMFRVVVYLAVPAFGGVFLGKWLDSMYGTGRTWSFVCLGIAFLTSWSLIIIQYRKLSVDLKKLEEMERKYPGKNK